MERRDFPFVYIQVDPERSAELALPPERLFFMGLIYTYIQYIQVLLHPVQIAKYS